MAFTRTKLSIMAFSITKLSIMAFSIIKLSIEGLFATLRLNKNSA